MRLGTDVVAVCWAEQMETNNRVEMAIARVVLKRRIEAPCGRSPGFNIFGVNDFEPWLTKRSASVITSKPANGSGRPGLDCFTLPPPVKASRFWCASSGDRI